MDIKEALNTIDDFYTFGESWRDFDDEDEIDKQREALSMAMSALKKQIAKKPKKVKVSRTLKIKTGYCSCGKFVLENENACSGCGQKLDWSD